MLVALETKPDGDVLTCTPVTDFERQVIEKFNLHQKTLEAHVIRRNGYHMPQLIIRSTKL